MNCRFANTWKKKHNRTRLIVTEFCNIFKARIITEDHSGREVHIPSDLGCTTQQCRQFPRPVFATSLYKAQGQTLRYVGVHLLTSVCMHGMLYLAFPELNCLNVFLWLKNPCHTRSVVRKEVLNNVDLNCNVTTINWHWEMPGSHGSL